VHLLVVEDDDELAQHLCADLQRLRYTTDVATTLADARRHLSSAAYDAIILDRLLPDGDGLTFLGELRDRGDRVPVLILSALGEVSDRVEGLRRGSDDYLVKPYHQAELDARLQALVRRTTQSAPAVEMTIGDMRIDVLARSVTRGGRTIRLQPREFALLEYLARNAGEVVTRAMLLESVWGMRFDPQTNVVDVHISRLRAKLDADGDPSLLHTVRGKGYRLAAPN
jgi:two-component system OmpR family response regulator